MGMVPLKCPGCGANIELDDSREFGFCNFCGTKVMQEKIVVEHQGSVKVDNSEYVEKFLQNAHRALSKEDWEEVEKYYNLVEQNAPNNMEAVFFSSFGKAMLSMTDSEYFKRQQKFKVLTNSMSVISDHFETTTEDKEQVLRTIDKYIDQMFNITFVYNTGAGYGLVGSRQWCVNLLNTVRTAFITELSQISEKHDDAYIIELLNKNKEQANKKSGGCYVATAVYGSYDCPQVWTLRRYRDNQLASTWYGRAFIHTYYAISPTIVKWFGETHWFKHMWKGKLDRMVNKLNNEGVENTPYNDIDW